MISPRTGSRCRTRAQAPWQTLRLLRNQATPGWLGRAVKPCYAGFARPCRSGGGVSCGIRSWRKSRRNQRKRIPFRKNGESCEYKKNGPRFNGGQVALVLSLCESLVGGLGGVAVGARMPRRKDEGLLRPIRASRGSNTLGWCSYLGRQTVCHQPYVHIACPHPRRLGVCIVG